MDGSHGMFGCCLLCFVGFVALVVVLVWRHRACQGGGGCGGGGGGGPTARASARTGTNRTNCHVLVQHSDKCAVPTGTVDVCKGGPSPLSDPIGYVQCWMDRIPSVNPSYNPILTMEPYDDGSQPPSGKLYGTNGVFGVSRYWFLSGPGSVRDSGDCRRAWGPHAIYYGVLSECRMRSEPDSGQQALGALLADILTAPVYSGVDGIAWLCYEDVSGDTDCVFRCRQPFGQGYFTFNQIRDALGLPMVLRPLG